MPDAGFLVEVCGRTARVTADSERALRFLQEILHPMICPDNRRADVTIRVSAAPNGFALTADLPTPRQTVTATLAELRHEVLICLMELRPDILWLHAGGAEKGGTALLACGPWGSGKSGLTAAFSDMGWSYLSDDIVGIDPNRTLAVPFPVAPVVRVPNGRGQSAPGIAKRQVKLNSEQVCRTPVPISVLLFVSHSHGAEVSLSQCPPGSAALKLLQSCMNFADHGERAVDLICELARTVPAYDLTFDDPRRAAHATAALHAPARAPHRRPTGHSH